MFRNYVDDTYDAFEKDIAIASFYFEEPTAYEYSRYVVSIDTWYVFINIKLQSNAVGTEDFFVFLTGSVGPDVYAFSNICG